MLSGILCIVIALLLSILGIFLQVSQSVGEIFDGFLSGLTQKLGPGVQHEPSTFARWPYVSSYVLALGFLVGGIYLMVYTS